MSRFPAYCGRVNGDGDREALAGLAARLLRRSQDETQLTKALRELMCAQPALGCVMVSELLGCVNAHPEIPSSAVTVVGEKPAVAERWLRPAQRVGRTDWVFRAPDDDFELVVEVKIGHVATAEQVARYVRSLKGKRGGVVLLTRDPTNVRVDSARFLGVVRWQKLLPRLLAARTPPSIESSLWRALLKHAMEPRGLGLPAASWAVLEAADANDRGRILADVARSAMDELIGHLSRSEAFRGASMKRGRTSSRWAILEMNNVKQRVFSFELAFADRLYLEAWAWPPKPQRARQRAWVTALRSACQAGWCVDGVRLHHGRREIAREGDLVADVLAHVLHVFEPLASRDLLPRYRGLGDAKGASAADLVGIE